MVSKKFRKALKENTAGEGEKRVYVQLPRVTDHTQHGTGEVRIHQK